MPADATDAVLSASQFRTTDHSPIPSKTNFPTLWNASIVHRKLAEADIGALQHLHRHLFPIDYDQSFFSRAALGDGILGYAAVAPFTQAAPEGIPDDTTVFVGNEQLVGFITAKELRVREIPISDRQLLGLAGSEYDDAALMYILTLGVAESFRKQGIARGLLERVEAAAAKAGCVALYLHVITYNDAASKFYEQSGFSCIAELKDFYFIQTGRALYPDVKNYDAYIFRKDIPRTLTLQQGSHLSMSYLWNQLTKVCMPCGGSVGHNYLGKKRAWLRGGSYENSENVIASAPTWLRGLFTGVKPHAQADSAHVA